jgi:hypothetical protein
MNLKSWSEPTKTFIVELAHEFPTLSIDVISALNFFSGFHPEWRIGDSLETTKPLDGDKSSSPGKGRPTNSANSQLAVAMPVPMSYGPNK